MPYDLDTLSKYIDNQEHRLRVLESSVSQLYTTLWTLIIAGAVGTVIVFFSVIIVKSILG